MGRFVTLFLLRESTRNSCTFIPRRIQIMIETISFPYKKFRIFVRCHLQSDSRLPDANLFFDLSVFQS